MRAGQPFILSSRARGVLLVAFAAMLWGTSGLTATIAYGRGIDPLTVSLWRMTIGAIALLPLLRRSKSWPTNWSDGRRLVLVGVGLAAYQACFFLAVERAGVSIATLLTLGLAPVMVTGAGRVLGRQRVVPATLVGIALAILGLAALVGLPANRTPGVVIGAWWAAGSAVGYATVTLSGGSLSARLGAPRLTVLAFAGSALVLLPVTAVHAGLGLGTDPAVLGAMLYLGTAPTALAYRCFFAGLERLPAVVAAVLALLEPLTATALAIPLLGERLTLVGWVGAGVLLSAVVLVSGTPASRQRHGDTDLRERQRVTR